MELLFVILIAFGIGLIAHYALPARDQTGSMLIPSISAALSAAIWVALLWAGWKFDGGWIWVVSLVAGGVAALVFALVLPRTRRVHDEAMYNTLSRA